MAQSRQPYIICTEGDENKVKRKMVVINGQPYYQSTGHNSSLPGIWLPFLAMKGTVPIDLNTSEVKFTRYYVIGSHYQPSGWIIKKIAGGVICPDSDTSAWNTESLVQKIQSNLEEDDKHTIQHILKLEQKSESEELTQDNIFDRLYLKSDFITALRLTEPSHWGCTLESLHQLAGLSEEEIKLSQQPLILADTPEFETEDSDKINKWLLEKNAATVNNILRETPASYQKIWDKVAGPNYQSLVSHYKQSQFVSDHELAERLERDAELDLTKALLWDYIKNDWAIKRFFTGHWNRHHIKFIREILTDNKFTNAIELVTHIRCSLGDDLNPTGSLAKRLCFIDQQIITNENKAIRACFSIKEWKEKNNKASLPVTPTERP